MAVDMQAIIREVLSGLQSGNGSPDDAREKSSSNGGLSGIKGLAAGAGAAALAPVALRTAGKLASRLGVDNLDDVVKSPSDALGGAKSKLGDRVASGAQDLAKGALDDGGGPSGLLKEAAKGMLPFGGSQGDASKDGAPGAGKGRRMPVQQSVDIGLPVETVYNQWTQFEEWPNFMHRVTRVTQEDDCTVSFATKIWGKTKEFTANIETQRPNERIKWRVSQGMTHTGVVTFHELGPNLTRVMLGLDVDPGSLIEKLARGARHIKRAARGDLHRFKGFIEMAEHETGAWRGVIEEGEPAEGHDPSYDKKRQYTNIEELIGEQDSDEEDEGNDEKQERESNQQEASRGKQSQPKRRSGGGARGRATSGGNGRSPSGQRSRKSGGSGKTRAEGPSSRGRGGGSTSSRSSSRSRSSGGSPKRQSGSRSGGGSQSRKR
jgi:uncharacterized membrane protein